MEILTSTPVIRISVYPHMLIAITRVVKDIFASVLNAKYKILLKIVYEILLSNTFDFTQKIQNTFVIHFQYKIQNTLHVFQKRIRNICISNTLQQWLSPSQQWPICHTTHGTRLSSHFVF